ncbi:MAG TPA: glycosyltransferase [Tepidisphaeraceae bacterium]|jgi:putative colanic acid biosynthesis acetyltransferase WcaF|nr:glycosyltransferase [Tepidisphaeraceae bacterium]
MLDVLIQTHNEELNLPHTLQSVSGWVNRIFVVDSGSTDRTREIAAEHGAVVVQKAWEGYARQKNWALANLPFESPWILILDADESVTPPLKDEILKVVSRPAPNVPESGFFLNRVTVFMGREIHHCAYFPAWNLRLFKRGSAQYEERNVHEHMIVAGPTGHLRHLLRHEDRRGLEHFIAKHNRYSTLEAMEIYRHQARWPGAWRFLNDRTARRRYIKYCVAPKLALPWFFRFVYMYFIRGGILDRRPGLTLCLLISTYELFIRAKYNELVRTGGKTPTGIEGLAVGEGGGAAAAAAPVVIPAMPPRPTPPQPPSPPIPIQESPAALRRRPVQVSPWKPMENIKRALWMIVRAGLFRPSFHNWYGWRRLLLELFGAKLGKGVRIRPTALVEIPWNLSVGDNAIIGDYAIIYSLGKISIGRGSTISQYAHLCAGTHDYTTRHFPLIKPPIVIGEEVWIAADAFVGPGVTIGDRAVVGARATVVKDVPADLVVAGPGAKILKPRILKD